MDTYHVKTEVFEGPLDLLLSLIEKRKLFINDISLAAVTDDYIEHINSEGVLALPSAAHFVYVASTLLLIKSKSLLPALTLTEEEAGDIEDLEMRLKLYQRVKELSRILAEQFGKRVLFERLSPEPEPVFAPGTLSLETLRRGIESILSDLPKAVKLSEAVVEKVVSLDEMIDRLTARITKAVKLSFKEFSGVSNPAQSRGERLTVIVSFLALLELFKRGAIGIRQEAPFDDMVIESERVDVPRYH